MHRIDVTGIKVFAFHGCLHEEERIGGNYIIDLSVYTYVGEAFSSDKLVDTIDYVLLNRIVEEEMAVRSKLIEHVANRILRRIKQCDKRIERARVKIRKLNPPINGQVDEVSFTLDSKEDVGI